MGQGSPTASESGHSENSTSDDRRYWTYEVLHSEVTRLLRDPAALDRECRSVFVALAKLPPGVEGDAAEGRVLTPADLARLTQRFIDRLHCADPNKVKLIGSAYQHVVRSGGVDFSSFRHYTTVILTYLGADLAEKVKTLAARLSPVHAAAAQPELTPEAPPLAPPLSTRAHSRYPAIAGHLSPFTTTSQASSRSRGSHRLEDEENKADGALAFSSLLGLSAMGGPSSDLETTSDVTASPLMADLGGSVASSSPSAPVPPSPGLASVPLSPFSVDTSLRPVAEDGRVPGRGVHDPLLWPDARPAAPFEALRNFERGQARAGAGPEEPAARFEGTPSLYSVSGDGGAFSKYFVFVFNVKLEMEPKHLLVSDMEERIVLRDSVVEDLDALAAQYDVEKDLVSAEPSAQPWAEFGLAHLVAVQLGHRAQFVRYLQPFVPPADRLVTLKFESGLLCVRFLSLGDRDNFLAIIASTRPGVPME